MIREKQKIKGFRDKRAPSASKRRTARGPKRLHHLHNEKSAASYLTQLEDPEGKTALQYAMKSSNSCLALLNGSTRT